MFTGFTEETIQFFLDLKFHNNASFFHEQHDRYIECVQRPFYEMIEDLAPGATKKSIRELISGAYSENRAGSDGKEEGNYLNTELSYAELEQVYQALQAIGYYKTVDNSKAQAKGFVKGIFDRNES